MKRERDDDEGRLFREAVRDVKPLTHDQRVVQAVRPPPRARFTRADRRVVLEESLSADTDDPALAGGEELCFRRPGVQQSVLRKLRRGQYHVQGEIDLHGLTVPQAKEALRAFLAHATQRRIRCVRIVHGKGLRSGPRGPVLKSAVGSILRRTDAVLAYSSAPRSDGGTGALYVLLAG